MELQQIFRRYSLHSSPIVLRWSPAFVPSICNICILLFLDNCKDGRAQAISRAKQTHPGSGRWKFYPACGQIERSRGDTWSHGACTEYKACNWEGSRTSYKACYQLLQCMDRNAQEHLPACGAIERWFGRLLPKCMKSELSPWAEQTVVGRLETGWEARRRRRYRPCVCKSVNGLTTSRNHHCIVDKVMYYLY